jgi:succinate-semialdehyde dehydrogenase/glutarate-semialdehyde dehydrogenase
MSVAKEHLQTKAVNPATGAIIGYSKLHSLDDLENFLSQARKVQDNWAKLPVKARVKYLKKVRTYLVDNADSIASVITSDNGKTLIDAFATELLASALSVSYYCRKAKKFLKDQKISASTFVLMNKRTKHVRVPYGVVGIISPWNYPFSIAFSEVIMALLAGNCVILKTANETQMVGLALKAAIEAADMPEGVFNYINMPGRIVGNAFLESGIDKLFFTGSVPVGKKIMAKAAETLTPVCLELGGNDAMIVCADADPERAVAGAIWAGFQNAGQSCGGVERIYVHENIYDEFVNQLKVKIEQLRVGDGSSCDIDMGVMTTEKQKRIVEEHIKEALDKGAKIHAYSANPTTDNLRNVHPAVVLTEVTHDMQLMKDETFGPVVGVMRIFSDEEAVKYANDSYLGLTGSVWSRNRKKAKLIARQIKAGVITINDHLMSHGLPESAWGGFKESGIGRSHGELGFNEMTQPQMIIDDVLPGVKRDLWWHPFDLGVYQGLKGLMYLLFSKNLIKKLTGIGQLLRILPRMFSAK